MFRVAGCGLIIVTPQSEGGVIPIQLPYGVDDDLPFCSVYVGSTILISHIIAIAFRNKFSAKTQYYVVEVAMRPWNDGYARSYICFSALVGASQSNEASIRSETLKLFC